MCHSPTIFLPLLPLRSYIKGNAPFFLDWAGLRFSLMLHSCLVFQRAVAAWKSTFKSYIILLFSCCPPSVPHLPLMSLLSSRHIFCFCICRGNNSDGRRDLPADLLIIHHSLFVATVRSGWVSSNLRIWGWDCTTTPRMTEGAVVVSGKVDRCAVFGMLSDILLACRPACHLWPGPSVAGMLMSAVLEHCHWSALWNVISDEANPF